MLVSFLGTFLETIKTHRVFRVKRSLNQWFMIKNNYV